MHINADICISMLTAKSSHHLGDKNLDRDSCSPKKPKKL